LTLERNELVEHLKIEWKRLWQDRLDDKVRAEGIAMEDYRVLFVEKGTVINATRDFKALNFKEVLEQNQIENPEKFLPSSPHVGGWSKFIKTSIYVSNQNRHNSALRYVEPQREKQQTKKRGRGWLHK